MKAILIMPFLICIHVLGQDVKDRGPGVIIPGIPSSPLSPTDWRKSSANDPNPITTLPQNEETSSLEFWHPCVDLLIDPCSKIENGQIIIAKQYICGHFTCDFPSSQGLLQQAIDECNQCAVDAALETGFLEAILAVASDGASFSTAWAAYWAAFTSCFNDKTSDYTKGAIRSFSFSMDDHTSCDW